MKVLILCGGKGTRAYPYTLEMPKALMPVQGLPIVEQVMRIYAHYGYRDFILSLGHLKEAIIDYFTSRSHHWNIDFVDTGEQTDTGGRIAQCAQYLTPTFHATYCDGLGDVDIGALEAFHQGHPGLATVTTVPLRSQYGLLYADGGGRVTHFEEKPVINDHWVNAGFLVFDRAVFDHWQGQNLEQDVLPHLASKGLLYAHQHQGFWRSMDTYKDQQELNDLWVPYSEGLRDMAAPGAKGLRRQWRIP